MHFYLQIKNCKWLLGLQPTLVLHHLHMTPFRVKYHYYEIRSSPQNPCRSASGTDHTAHCLYVGICFLVFIPMLIGTGMSSRILRKAPSFLTSCRIFVYERRGRYLSRYSDLYENPNGDVLSCYVFPLIYISSIMYYR